MFYRGKRLLRHFYDIQDLVNNLLAGNIFGFGFISKADAVPHYVVAYRADIFGNYITAALDERISFGRMCQADAGSVANSP